MTDIQQYLLEQAGTHHFLQSFPKQEIEQAISTSFDLFPDTIKPVFQGMLALKVTEKDTQGVSVLDEVLPALVLAHRHFGRDLPSGLIQKLRNPPQVRDTFFELKCFGMFQDKHKIVYEPRLFNKTPDNSS